MDYKHARESQVSITELMLPSHSNFGGKVHGGHILNLMDQIAFACASKHSSSYCVTASVNRVDFMQPVEVGELLTLKASVNYTGRTSMVIGVRVVAENITTGKKKHCNSSYITMVAKDEAGRNKEVPGLILRTEEDVRRFVRSRIRREEARDRDHRFDRNSFTLADHLAEIDGENASLEFKASP